MSKSSGSVGDLVDMIQKKAPEYLDLLTAKTDAQFETAFDAVLEMALTHLEKNKKHFEKLDEEGLSAVLAGSMSIPGLTVSQEKHSGGHVDLTFEADHCMPARTKLGEAKIYNGYKYHEGGLFQLLGRYTTGRECRGLLIVYVRKKDIKGLVDKLKSEMDKHQPLGQTGKAADHTLKWSFISMHNHSSGEELYVCHVGCNLHVS